MLRPTHTAPRTHHSSMARTRIAAKATALVSTAPPTTTDRSLALKERLDSQYAMLQANADRWRTLPLKDKVLLLQEIQTRMMDNMYTWGRVSADTRGLGNDKWGVAESTLLDQLAISKYIAALIDSLGHMAAHDACPPPAAVRTTASGQTVVRVFPATPRDKADPVAAGTTADVYIQPGETASQGGVYKQGKGGKVAAVLGAGNLGFLGLKDILYMLFERNNVVMYKPHPVQARWHEYADLVLEPLARTGVYASVYAADVEETQAMLYHPAVQHVHMTGGTATHDAIVWGADPGEQARRKAANDPVLKVPITSELGCVTPWIVTPGAWTEAQLQAQSLGAVNSALLANACACNSLKVLILPQSWAQADQFLDMVKAGLKAQGQLPAWYPGHNTRYNAWRSMFPGAQALDDAPVVPPSRDLGPSASPMPFLINEVPFPQPHEPLTKEQEYAFTVEPFAPVLTVVRVPAASTDEYMQKATWLCNERLWGTLSCSVLLHPDTEREHPEASQKMLDELRYGAVAVNAMSAASYATPHCVWGAYGGNQTTADIGSGIGHINNTLFLDHPQKVVLRMDMTGAAVPKPINTMGLPAWVVGPLVGLLVGGFKGLLRASWSRK